MHEHTLTPGDMYGKFEVAAQEERDMMLEIMDEHHEQLYDESGHGMRVVLLLKEGNWEKNGRWVAGEAKKVGDRERLLTGFEFMIVLNAGIWRRLEVPQKKALLDHELCHCAYGGRGPMILGHDVEEFGCIVERHGLWTEDLLKFAEPFKQGELFTKQEIELARLGKALTEAKDGVEVAVKVHKGKTDKMASGESNPY